MVLKIAEALLYTRLYGVDKEEQEEARDSSRMARQIIAHTALKALEEAGMAPPPVKAKKVMGEDYPWGAGCTSRCNCDSCNPDYPVHSWEPE